MEIPIYYDPMISKLVTYGKSREEAIQTMIEAIDSYLIDGVKTTLPFGRFVMQHESFRTASFDTHFVKNYYSPEKLMAERFEEMKVAARLALKLYLDERKKLKVNA
jgi:propionyl-CoA carboxylase alpha chain